MSISRQTGQTISRLADSASDDAKDQRCRPAYTMYTSVHYHYVCMRNGKIHRLLRKVDSAQYLNKNLPEDETRRMYIQVERCARSRGVESIRGLSWVGSRCNRVSYILTITSEFLLQLFSKTHKKSNSCMRKRLVVSLTVRSKSLTRDAGSHDVKAKFHYAI